MIKLDKKYWLGANSNEFNICTENTEIDKKTGEEKTTYPSMYHYGSIDSALKGYIKIKTRDAIKNDVVTTLDELIALMPKIEKQIEIIAKRIDEAKI